MSDEAAEVAALARAFSAHLKHLREFRGLAYVGAAPMSGGSGGSRSEETEVDDRPGLEVGDGADSVEARVPAPGEHPPADPAGAPSPQTDRSPSPSSRLTRGESSGQAGPRSSAPPSSPGGRAQDWSAARKLTYLRERNVGDCQRCSLSRGRRNIVFGVGSPEADLMFVGEAPGADEDRLGEPFVGRAGALLDQWLAQLELARESVYIANVLKCRPPRNRDPQGPEIQRCAPFLHAQIRAISPRVIVALGRFAGCLLAGTERKMYEMRGQVHHYVEPKSGARIPLVVTYHPSYVLRRDSENARNQGGGQRGGGGPGMDPQRGSPIKSEGEKVLADIRRAVAIFRP